MMNEEEIQVLIDKSKKQDMTAFALLVTEYRQLVFRLAFRLLCNEEEARDMVQETFIKVWLNLDKYNREYRFSTWLYKITGNICLRPPALSATYPFGKYARAIRRQSLLIF